MRIGKSRQVNEYLVLLIGAEFSLNVHLKINLKT